MNWWRISAEKLKLLKGSKWNTKTEKCNNIKNSLDVLNSMLNMKEQFEDLESRCIEMISSTRWGGRKQLRWNEQIPRGLLMNIISSKIIVIRVLEKNGKKQGRNNIWRNSGLKFLKFDQRYSLINPRNPVSHMQDAAMLLLSHFGRVWLCATPETAAHQAPPSLGFSRQEHWSGLPFPSPMTCRMTQKNAHRHIRSNCWSLKIKRES